jgi:hypothetical protein
MIKNEKKSITIKLKGSADNVNALGAKVFVFLIMVCAPTKNIL